MENSLREIIFLSYISENLLVDWCIIHQPGRKPKFQFIHTFTDFEWCNYCYEQLLWFFNYELFIKIRKDKEESVTPPLTLERL